MRLSRLFCFSLLIPFVCSAAPDPARGTYVRLGNQLVESYTLAPDARNGALVVTARRLQLDAQRVPVPYLSTGGGAQRDSSVAFTLAGARPGPYTGIVNGMSLDLDTPFGHQRVTLSTPAAVQSREEDLAIQGQFLAAYDRILALGQRMQGVIQTAAAGPSEQSRLAGFYADLASRYQLCLDGITPHAARIRGDLDPSPSCAHQALSDQDRRTQIIAGVRHRADAWEAEIRAIQGAIPDATARLRRTTEGAVNHCAGFDETPACQLALGVHELARSADPSRIWPYTYPAYREATRHGQAVMDATLSQALSGDARTYQLAADIQQAIAPRAAATMRARPIP